MSHDARSLSQDAQAALRRRAVDAVLAGMKQTAAAVAFGVTRQAVGNWMKAYRRGGHAALAAHKRGPKRPRRKLMGWQAAAVCNRIRDRYPEQIKLPFFLWTSDAVRQVHMASVRGEFTGPERGFPLSPDGKCSGRCALADETPGAGDASGARPRSPRPPA